MKNIDSTFDMNSIDPNKGILYTEIERLKKENKYLRGRNKKYKAALPDPKKLRMLSIFLKNIPQINKEITSDLHNWSEQGRILLQIPKKDMP